MHISGRKKGTNVPPGKCIRSDITFVHRSRCLCTNDEQQNYFEITALKTLYKHVEITSFNIVQHKIKLSLC